MFTNVLYMYIHTYVFVLELLTITTYIEKKSLLLGEWRLSGLKFGGIICSLCIVLYFTVHMIGNI